jgi:hypothetical protein
MWLVGVFGVVGTRDADRVWLQPSTALHCASAEYLQRCRRFSGLSHGGSCRMSALLEASERESYTFVDAWLSWHLTEETGVNDVVGYEKRCVFHELDKVPMEEDVGVVYSLFTCHSSIS